MCLIFLQLESICLQVTKQHDGKWTLDNRTNILTEPSYVNTSQPHGCIYDEHNGFQIAKYRAIDIRGRYQHHHFIHDEDEIEVGGDSDFDDDVRISSQS